MKSEGLILDSIDYKESSKIVHLYTIYGHVSVKANRASNPKSGFLGFTTTGNIVSYVATDSELPSLSEYEILHSSYKISEDYLKASVFMVMLEVIKGIPEDADHKKIYPFIRKIIESITKEDSLKLLTIFLTKMLYAFGVAPSLKSCITCGSTEVISLDLLKGGACCSFHSNGKDDGLRIFQEYYYSKKEITEYSDADYKKMLKSLGEYYQKYTHLTLKLSNLHK